MSLASLSLLQTLLIVLAYWIVVFAVYLILPRRHVSPTPEQIEVISPTMLKVTGEGSIPYGGIAAVALLPPVVLLVAWLLARG